MENRDARSLIEDALSEVETMLEHRSAFDFHGQTLGAVDSGAIHFTVSFLDRDCDQQDCIVGIWITSKRLRTSICRVKGLRGEDANVLPLFGKYLSQMINGKYPNMNARLVGLGYEPVEASAAAFSVDPPSQVINEFKIVVSVSLSADEENMRNPSWWWEIIELRECLLNSDRWGNY